MNFEILPTPFLIGPIRLLSSLHSLNIFPNFSDITLNHYLLNSLKNNRNKAIIIYKALGYGNWEIALEIGISERSVGRILKKFRKSVML